MLLSYTFYILIGNYWLFFFLNRSISAGPESRNSPPLRSRGPSVKYHELPDSSSKVKTSGWFSSHLGSLSFFFFFIMTLLRKALFNNVMVSVFVSGHRWAALQHHGVHLHPGWFHSWAWTHSFVLWKWAFVKKGSKVCTSVSCCCVWYSIWSLRLQLFGLCHAGRGFLQLAIAVFLGRSCQTALSSMNPTPRKIPVSVPVHWESGDLRQSFLTATLSTLTALFMWLPRVARKAQLHSRTMNAVTLPQLTL